MAKVREMKAKVSHETIAGIVIADASAVCFPSNDQCSCLQDDLRAPGLDAAAQAELYAALAQAEHAAGREAQRQAEIAMRQTLSRSYLSLLPAAQAGAERATGGARPGGGRHEGEGGKRSVYSW